MEQPTQHQRLSNLFSHASTLVLMISACVYVYAYMFMPMLVAYVYVYAYMFMPMLVALCSLMLVVCI
jgi:hypothetical protein